jgi:hypothetical protein
MASTVVAAVVRDMRLTVAWVGDSRAYLVRNGIARCLTADHSWVGEAVARRLLTEEQAVDHPRRNQITRSLGSADTPTIDIVEELLEPGDTIVLCSDGLYRLVDQDEFSALVRGGIAGAAQRLVTLANDRGGDDNVTVVVARVPGGTADDFSTMPTLVDPRGGWDAESSGSGAAPYRTTAPWMALAAITVVTAVAVFLMLLAVERWYWTSTGAPSVSTPTPSRAGIAPTLIPATTVSPTVAPLPTMVTLVPPRDGVGRSSHDGDHGSKVIGRADATTARLAVPPTRLDVRGSCRTTRECRQTEKSHISHVVLDTTTWEASVTFQLATSPLVQTYARNDHLELAIPYDFLGHHHRYYPDFIVRLTNGVSLLLEVKGQEDEQDRQKYTAARRWAEAVTAWGEMGVWHFGVCKSREDVPAILARFAALASAAA